MSDVGLFASLGAEAFGTANTFMAEQRQADAERARAEYEGRQYEAQAKVDEGEAADALTRGAIAANRQRLEVRQLIGTQRAALAAGNVDVSSGSALDVQTQTAKIGELDAMTIKNNAAREAWGFTTEALFARQRGAMAQLAGINTESGMRSRAYGTLLTGATQMYGTWKEGRPKQPRGVGSGKP